MTDDYKTVALDLGERSYNIHIGKGLLKQAADLLPFSLEGRKVFILYDKNTYPFAQVLEEALAGKAEQVLTMGVPGGEQTKSFKALEEVLDWMLSHKVDRHSVFFAVGGGVIGDLGGFAASTVMRGIAYIQIPTTLLAQVDSSVGGKTGINTARGKNLVGSFYQPKMVLCDTDTLVTLPERELKAGYAEVAKYGLINDMAFFEWLEENGNDVLSLENSAVTYAIEKSCQAKAAIVAEDEREGGKRALLNLGHTFGHALEAAAEYDGRLLHGEAVSIGMVMAFRLSQKMGLCAQEVPSRVAAHLSDCGLKIALQEITPHLKHTPDELYNLMLSDKKAKAGQIGFILARGIGEAFQTYDVAQEDVIGVLK